MAIIGCGYVARSHLTAWRRIPYAKIVAVCDKDEQAVRRVANEWKISKSFTSISEMSKVKDISLWDICTPIQTHKQIAIQAMRDGFDVLIEKPLTMTSKDSKEIIECQKVTHRKAGVVHNWLFEPSVLEAKSIVKSGKTGEIIGTQIGILHPPYEPMTMDKNHWSHSLPGGRFSENLIHPIYLLRAFLGQIETQSLVVSKAGKHSWMKSDELLATFRAGEKLGSTFISFNAPRYARFIDLFGRMGVVRLDMTNSTVNFLPSAQLRRFGKASDALRQAAQLTSSTLKNALRIVSRHWVDGHEMCIRLFAESLVTDERPPVTLEEACDVVRILEDAADRIEALQKSVSS